MLERIVERLSIYFISNTNNLVTSSCWVLASLSKAQHITGRKRDEATRYI
jgi:hypothetical protein